MAIPVARLVVSANFTRPADTTAYTSGDLVANSTTAGSVVPMNFANAARSPNVTIQVRRVRITTSSTSVTASSFRLHLYTTGTITCANGDNGAWSTNSAANYLGRVDVTVDEAFTDGACGSATTEINCHAVGGNSIYGLLEARGAYTPTSAEAFTVALEVTQD